MNKFIFKNEIKTAKFQIFNLNNLLNNMLGFKK